VRQQNDQWYPLEAAWFLVMQVRR